MSWQQLIAIVELTQKELRALEERKPPTCPHDGRALDVSSTGEYSCRFGDFAYPEDLIFPPDHGTGVR